MDFFRKNQSKLVHRNTNNSANSPGTEASYPLAERSQEHIYTYANDKNKRSVPNTPGRKQFKITCIVLFVIGLYLLFFSLFVIIRGGYSGRYFNDINANCRYAMIILAGFVIFMSFTGYSGAYTNWKPIILTFSVLASMAFLGHLYVAKKLLDATRFTERDMAISWWDVYTDPIRMQIQDRFNCCGYKNYGDYPVASNFCLGTDVDFVTQYSPNVKYPADVVKNDSYRKKFSTADSVVDSNNAGSVAATNQNTNQNQAQAANQNQAQAANQNQAQAANQNQAQAANQNQAQAANQDPAPAVNQDPAPAVNQDPAPAVNQDPAAAVQDNQAAQQDQFGGMNNGGMMMKKAKVKQNKSKLSKRQQQQQETKVEDLQISQASGCMEHLVPIIKSKLKLMYILNYLCCIAYLVAIGMSLYYWQNMRKEKEFD